MLCLWLRIRITCGENPKALDRRCWWWWWCWWVVVVAGASCKYGSGKAAGPKFCRIDGRPVAPHKRFCAEHDRAQECIKRHDGFSFLMTTTQTIINC